MDDRFIILDKYKGYSLYKMNHGGIVWADVGGWLDCVFDTEETTKYFIDNKRKFKDNFFDVISEAQKIAIKENDGLVNLDIINKFEILEK